MSCHIVTIKGGEKNMEKIVIATAIITAVSMVHCPLQLI